MMELATRGISTILIMARKICPGRAIHSPSVAARLRLTSPASGPSISPVPKPSTSPISTCAHRRERTQPSSERVSML